MRHFASSEFWQAYQQLPKPVRDLADKNFALLKTNPDHPSLRLKRVGQFWSATVGLNYRALATGVDGGLSWFWIGSHADYDKMLG